MIINDEHGLVVYGPSSENIYDTTDEVNIPTGINVPATGWYYRELSHFIDCHQKGVPSPFVGEQQILSVMEVLEKITEKDKVEVN